MAKAIVLQLVK